MLLFFDALGACRLWFNDPQSLEGSLSRSNCYVILIKPGWRTHLRTKSELQNELGKDPGVRAYVRHGIPMYVSRGAWNRIPNQFSDVCSQDEKKSRPRDYEHRKLPNLCRCMSPKIRRWAVTQNVFAKKMGEGGGYLILSWASICALRETCLMHGLQILKRGKSSQHLQTGRKSNELKLMILHSTSRDFHVRILTF